MRKLALTFALLGASTLGALAQGGYQDGIDYYKADRYEQAAIILNRTLNDPGTNKGIANYYLGAIALRQGDKAAARRYFNAGIEADAACGYNYIGLGELALASGNKKEAEGFFSDALKADKKDPALNAAIARAYFNADPAAYAKEIDKYIAAAFKASKNKSGDVYVLQGDIAKALGNVGEAASAYEGAMVFSEEDGHVNPEAYVKYANLYTTINPQFSIDKLILLKQKAPTSALAQRELAEKYYDAEQYGKAAAEYREYMNNPNHFQQDEQRYSQLLFFGGNNDQSLAIAKNVLKADPANAYMYRMVMLNDAALGNLDEAAEYAAKLFGQNAVALTTNDYNTYGDVLEKLGRPDEAIAVYEQAYNANPEKNREMLATMSSLYTDMENFEKAAEMQQRYVDTGDVKLNDYFVLSNRYRNLAISMAEGSAERADAAQKGLDVVALAMDRATNPLPLLRNKAILLQLRDGQAGVSDELAQTYLKMIELLDADPENKTSQVNAYRSAYGTLAGYYLQQGNKPESDRYKALFDEVSALVQ